MAILFGRQVYNTFSMEEQARVRSLFASNGIEYRLKVVNRRSASSFGNGQRSYTGSYGEDASMFYEYIFCVRKGDLERAKALI